MATDRMSAAGPAALQRDKPAASDVRVSSGWRCADLLVKRKGGKLAGSETVRPIVLNSGKSCNSSNSFFFALFYDYS
jgi:hypothetical protein